MRTRTLAASTAVALAAALAGCSSNSSADPTASPTNSASVPTASPTEPTAQPTPTEASCTKDSLDAALPEGAIMLQYKCEYVGSTNYAAVLANPGPTAFFAIDTKGTWRVSTSDQICGTASAGWPESLLAFCSKARTAAATATATSSVTPTASPVATSSKG